MNDSQQTGVRTSTAVEPNGWWWLPLSGIVIALDQLTKAMVLSRFDLYERMQLLPVLDFTLVYNTGAAFSFLAGESGWQRWLFVALALAVGTAIIMWMRRLKARSQGLLACSLSLILGGAVGNAIDRLQHGHVVDFILAYWGDAQFPAFNVADSAITVGAVLLLIDAFQDARRSKKAAS